VQWWQKMLLQGEGETKRRNRATNLHLSEIITIMLAYHETGYRCFKDYYAYVLFHHRKEFPHLVSYDRFVALMKRTFGAVIMMFAALRGEVCLQTQRLMRFVER
jgi:phage terminase large subunit-like protein